MTATTPAASPGRLGPVMIELAATISALVLLGWVLHVEPMKRLAPGLTSMNPLTAITFELACAALWLLSSRPVRRPGIAVALGAIVLTVGGTKIVDLIAGTSLCPDDMLFRSQLTVGQAFPSTIAPNTALCFALLGLGIVGTDRGLWWKWIHPQILVIPILGLSLAAVVGYAYDTSGFYRYQHYIPMALHTALCFGLTATALTISRPDQALLRLIPAGSLGARSYLRLLPACILVPLLLGALELAGTHAGWFTSESGASTTVVSVAVTMSLLAYLNAVAINRSEHHRTLADQELKTRVEEDRRALDRAQALSDLEEKIRIHKGRFTAAAPEILAMIARRVGALQAVMYRNVLGSNDRHRLEVLAAHAHDGPQQLQARFAIGEGPVGQCALDRQRRTLEPVPAGYFLLRSGAFNASPQRLDFLPIVVDDECVGVLELAYFGGRHDSDAEKYLRAALRPLAFALFRDVDRSSSTRFEMAGRA